MFCKSVKADYISKTYCRGIKGPSLLVVKKRRKNEGSCVSCWGWPLLHLQVLLPPLPSLCAQDMPIQAQMLSLPTLMLHASLKHSDPVSSLLLGYKQPHLWVHLGKMHPRNQGIWRFQGDSQSRYLSFAFEFAGCNCGEVQDCCLRVGRPRLKTMP